MAYIISAGCTRCGACLAECPTGSIIAGPAQFHIDVDTCDDHAACVRVCPVNAISPVSPEGRAQRHGQKESRRP